MRTLESWLAEISSTPTDWDLWGVFSDWLEDTGDLVAAAWARWVRDNQRKPYYSSVISTPWGWWNCTILGTDLSEIPEWLMPDLAKNGGTARRLYPTYQAAMLDLLAAWREVRTDPSNEPHHSL